MPDAAILSGNPGETSQQFEIMKNLIIVAASLTCLSFAVFADEGPGLQITGFTLNGSQATMTWTNGKPTYQVQTCADLAAGWVNVGDPTSNTVANIPCSGDRAFFRVVSDFTARYQFVFNSTWSSNTHPANFPTNAHWSRLVGGTHNSNVHFWREGETATTGIQDMAEHGKTTVLAEIDLAITNGTANFELLGPQGGTPSAFGFNFAQPMRRDYPLATLVTMIAPSSDWFVGVDSLSLLDENSQWVTNKTVTVYGMDAGTSAPLSDLTYYGPFQVTVPRGVVTQMAGFPALVNGTNVPFGTFTFTRLD